MMTFDGRIIDKMTGIDSDLPDDALSGKEIQRVVDRGFRDPRSGLMQTGQNLLLGLGRGGAFPLLAAFVAADVAAGIEHAFPQRRTVIGKGEFMKTLLLAVLIAQPQRGGLFGGPSLDGQFIFPAASPGWPKCFDKCTVTDNFVLANGPFAAALACSLAQSSRLRVRFYPLS